MTSDQFTADVDDPETRLRNALDRHPAGKGLSKPLTRDDVRAIVSEEIGKVGDLLRETFLDGGDATFDFAKRDDEIGQDEFRRRQLRALTYQFKESDSESRDGCGALGNRPSHDDVGQVCVRCGLTHKSSPSVDGTSTATVGDALVGGDASATPSAEVTLESLAEAVREALVDETATYRIRDAAKLGLDEAEVNLAYAKCSVLHAEHALREYISNGTKVAS